MPTLQNTPDTDRASPSHHACLICRSADERWYRLADFVRTGLGLAPSLRGLVGSRARLPLDPR